MLFRACDPELCEYIEDEEVTPNMWAMHWVEVADPMTTEALLLTWASQYVLSPNLPLDCLFRLWDTYFSTEEGLDLHLYVCIGTAPRARLSEPVVR